MLSPEWITEFNGHTFAITGRVLLDGEWTFRPVCVEMALARGAKEWKPDMSGQVTLLVYGDLASSKVSDRARQYSKKLRIAEFLRSSGRPVAVVDAAGFSDLCVGLPARNRELRSVESDEYLVLPQLGEQILGGPLALRRVPDRPNVTHALQMTSLDAGAAAHEATVEAFVAVLAKRGRVAERPSRSAPPFDIGWLDGTDVYVAEVKSFGGEAEVDQVRRGLGQVQDYAQRVREISGMSQSIVPALILEREPQDAAHWARVLGGAGVRLAWGPAFEWM